RLAELEATQAHQRRLMDANEWLRAYEESRFHQTLVESLENPVFLAAARVVQAQLRRIQNLASTIPGRLAKTHAEHEAVLHGIRACDVAAAQQAMRVHIRSVLEDTLRSSELRRITSAGVG
ncbi:MAG TPA: FCD domain-containing protein, partial [Methylomirabilota bacterium]|nr:FCD domain-containing protein [Methylomirabilota bacterium]